MNKVPKSLIARLSALVIALIIVVMLPFIQEKPNIDINSKTFKYLSEIREDKKELTLGYFEEIENSAASIAHDEVMQNYFLRLASGTTPSIAMISGLDRHFIENYGSFYDLLMVDTSGYVFHTIKQETDYRTNLINGELRNTKLAQSLKNSRSTNFSDFEYYYPSNESAAFFVVPVKDQSDHQGWFILQCAINQINTILTNREQFGRTVEVYLVNNDNLMLSDSRFIEDQTILKLKIETESVKHARFQDSGENIIVDYRGARVFSSFEKFNYFNTSWVIIAEIDEAEVVSEHYRDHKDYFNGLILQDLSKMQHLPKDIPETPRAGDKVDVNEWSKAIPGEILQTTGVSTCTAYTIEYPKKFAYLAHISAMDAVYGIKGMTKIFLKDRSTNFVRELTNRVRYYDVTLSEIPKLEFLIVAVHKNSYAGMVEQLLDQGIELDQIRFAYNPAAKSASVRVDVSSNQTIIIWHSYESYFIEFSKDYETLGEIVKKHTRT